MSATKPTPKRVKVESLGRGAGAIWQRTKDGAFEHVYTDPATGKQHGKTLVATTRDRRSPGVRGSRLEASPGRSRSPIGRHLRRRGRGVLHDGRRARSGR